MSWLSNYANSRRNAECCARVLAECYTNTYTAVHNLHLSVGILPSLGPWSMESLVLTSSSHDTSSTSSCTGSKHSYMCCLVQVARSDNDLTRCVTRIEGQTHLQPCQSALTQHSEPQAIQAVRLENTDYGPADRACCRATQDSTGQLAAWHQSWFCRHC